MECDTWGVWGWILLVTAEPSEGFGAVGVGDTVVIRCSFRCCVASRGQGQEVQFWPGQQVVLQWFLSVQNAETFLEDS